MLGAADDDLVVASVIKSHMSVQTLSQKAFNLYTRTAYRSMFRRSIRMRNRLPLISFSFDDFPRSAYEVGGAILKNHGFCGTYYAALGLMSTVTPVGEIFSRADLPALLLEGHELGCHTYHHCHSWRTAPGVFENSVLENQRCLTSLVPRASFKTLSYPQSGPRPHTKRRVSKHFACCRFGGQTYNAGNADRNLLSAYFLEQSGYDLDAVATLVDKSVGNRGWLIFATHDVCDNPSRFGCTSRFFADVVRYASRSGAAVLPVGEAWELVSGTTPLEPRE